MFNKDTGLKRSQLTVPDVKLPINTWLRWNDMTPLQQTDNPKAETVDGVLIVMSYKDAWKKAWQSMDESKKADFLNLPNFDANIFKEITGIDVKAEVQVVANGKTVYISKESAEALGLLD